MHPAYWHVGIPPEPMTHAALWLCTVSQAFPQAPHDEVDVSDVSQPFVFAPDWSQSASPAGHGPYWQVNPPPSTATHWAPKLWLVSQAIPQPPQLRESVGHVVPLSDRRVVRSLSTVVAAVRAVVAAVDPRAGVMPGHGAVGDPRLGRPEREVVEAPQARATGLNEQKDQRKRAQTRARSLERRTPRTRPGTHWMTLVKVRLAPP